MPSDGLEAPAQVLGFSGETVLGNRLSVQTREGALDAFQVDAVLRALRPRERGHHRRQVEFQRLAVINVALLRHAVQALCPEVGGEGIDLFVSAAGAAEILDRPVVDREEAHRRAILGRHVGERCAIGDRQRRGSLAEELDELAHHLGLAQHLGDREHQIGRVAGRVQPALQVQADDVRGQEVDRLPEHACLCLDAADAPANHANAVDHRGVAVGADQRVRVVHPVSGHVHAAREVFEVHLMHDADTGRHDLECFEGLHAPFHELVALLVPLEFQLHVEVECILGAVVVDLHRVVHHQVDRHQRLDDLGVLAHLVRHAAHRGEVGQQRHAGEILQHDACHYERDLFGAWRIRLPVRQLAHMRLGDLLAVAVAQHRFQHDADRNRQARDPA